MTTTRKRTRNTPRPGTIGAAIAKLVKKYGDRRTGVYILERALVEAVTGDDEYHALLIDGKPISQHEHYRNVCAQEDALIARIEKEIGKGGGI